MNSEYAKQVGDRLRSIRLQKGLSLHDVEESSGKEFKASVLGAYERGERSISVPRLQRLAAFYGVPVDQLLPATARQIDGAAAQRPAADRSVCIDLTKLREVDSPELRILDRYVGMIQMARGDFNGKILTVRGDDVRTLAAVFETTPEGFTTRLDDLGVRVARVG
ncbi:MAG TPA: transcriptional regulator [Actinomycetota bacterium]